VKKRFGAIVGTAALLAAACSPAPDEADTPAAGSADGDTSEPYRIVHLIGQNQPGPAALNAKAAAQAVQAAVDVLNEDGGILGHPVELEIIDDNGDPTTAVTKLQQRLASGPKPNLILPGNTSAEALPMAPIITDAGILSVQQASADALDDPPTYPYLFKTPPVPATWAQDLAEYAQEQGITKIAMLSGKDAFSTATATATEEALGEAGIEIASETYAPEDLDMTAQLSRLKSENPDLLYVIGAGAPIGYALESRVKIDWTDTPLLTDSTASVTSLLSQAAPDGLVGTEQTENTFVHVLASAVEGAEQANAEGTQTMIDALKEHGPINLPLNVYFAYDAVMLAAQAAEETDTITDAAAQAEWLETVTPDVKGKWSLTAYTFTPESHGPAVDTSAVEIIPVTVLEEGRYPAS
jgi:branched-chain amino acid transport system substrate-binding protein